MKKQARIETGERTSGTRENSGYRVLGTLPVYADLAGLAPGLSHLTVTEIDVRTFFAPIREYRNALMAGYAKVCAIRDEMRKQQGEQ